VNRQVILAVENQGAATYGHDTENGNHHRDLAGPRVPVLGTSACRHPRMHDPPVDALPAQAPARALERHSLVKPQTCNAEPPGIAAPNPRHVDGQGFAFTG
jgi:hypothetical protein